MSSVNDDLKIYECSVSNDGHFLKEPKLLSCNHMVCRRCIKTDRIKCRICDTLSNSDSIKNDVTQLYERSIENHLEKMLSKLLERFMQSFDKLNSTSNSTSTRIEDTVNFLIGEIEIRIETLKTDLEILRDKLVNDLNSIKNDVLGQLKKLDETSIYEAHLFELKKILENKESEKKSMLYQYEDHLSNMNGLIAELQECSKIKIDFTPSDAKINDSMVGSISYENTMLSKRISDAIRSRNFDMNELWFKPLHSCLVQDSYVLFSCLDENKDTYLALFNSNFDQISKIDSINNQKITPIGIDSCGTAIFISDNTNNRVIKTDLEFNFLKEFAIEKPLAITCSNQNVYVTQANSITFLSLDLQPMATYNVDFKLRNIKIINNTMLIRPSDCSYMCVYEITDNAFILKHKIMGINGSIGVVGSMFYIYDNVNQILYRYSCFGDPVEEIKNANFGLGVASIMNFKNKLVIPIISNKLIVINL